MEVSQTSPIPVDSDPQADAEKAFMFFDTLRSKGLEEATARELTVAYIASRLK